MSYVIFFFKLQNTYATIFYFTLGMGCSWYAGILHIRHRIRISYQPWKLQQVPPQLLQVRNKLIIAIHYLRTFMDLCKNYKQNEFELPDLRTVFRDQLLPIDTGTETGTGNPSVPINTFGYS